MSVGIVRRIDELGRIVIPKELRRTMRLKEGDEMEILSSGDSIVLKRYSGFESALGMVESVAALLSETTGADVLFMSTERVQVAEGKNKKLYSGGRLTDNFAEQVRARRQGKLNADEIEHCLIGIKPPCKHCRIEPVVVGGDLVGAAALFADEDIGALAASYLGFCVKLIEASLG